MTNYETRQFMIFNVSELNNINFDEVLQTSKDTVTVSIDGTKTFVKWEGNKIPNSVDNLITKEGPYNYTEVEAMFKSNVWFSDVNI